MYVPFSQTASARGAYLTQWSNIYTTSSSGTQAGCQLCHQRSDGGNGWNAYGWDIRQAWLQEGNITAAINSVASLNSDSDGLNNVDEINSNQQPGWRDDDENTIFCKSPTSETFCNGGTELSNQPSPDFSSLIPDPIQKGESISLSLIADGFTAPNLAIAPPEENGFLYVVDQPGIIWKVNLSTNQKSVFLDVSNQIVVGGERGLLGLAFHPDYQTNHLLYTYQSEVNNGNGEFPSIPSNHQSVIAEWDASALSNDQVNLATKREILRIGQPQGNHNGGMIAFGPDKLLYISLGDGGSADDQGSGHSTIANNGFLGNGQDTTNPLGSMLRIDPLINSQITGTISTNGAYKIPSNNPFVSNSNNLPEIYAIGLRNVFRFSFDSEFGDLYAADVGQNHIEEVSFISSGQNLGWPIKEGSFWFDQNGSNSGFATMTPPIPAPTNLSDPIVEYDHDEGVSVIGGYVYRGDDLPQLNGRYIFGELFRRIFYIDASNTIKEFDTVEDVDISVLGFGQDNNGEVYVTGTSNFASSDSGKLYKIIPPVETPTPPADNDDLCFPIKAFNSKIAVVCL